MTTTNTSLCCHRGISFSLELIAIPDTWRWTFEFGGNVRSGTTRARLRLLAERRVRMVIDREIKQRDE